MRSMLYALAIPHSSPPQPPPIRFARIAARMAVVWRCGGVAGRHGQPPRAAGGSGGRAGTNATAKVDCHHLRDDRRYLDKYLDRDRKASLGFCDSISNAKVGPPAACSGRRCAA